MATSKSEQQAEFHQVLAVERELRRTGDKIIDEAKATFQGKTAHFDGLRKSYTPTEETEGVPVEQIPDEESKLVTTVDEKLNFVREQIIPSIDVTATKEESNSAGALKAEIVVNGKTHEFSATTLLALETHVTKLRSLCLTVPTLDPKKNWQLSDQSGVYETAPIQAFRTVQREVPVELSKATDKHKAQVELRTVPIQTGYFETVYSSGRKTPLNKAQMLTRLDNLLNKIKEARSRANSGPIKNILIAGDILEEIFGECD